MTEWIFSASVLILIVLGLRAILKGRIALRLQYALWLVVLVRLVVPVSLGTSRLSVSNVLPAPAPVLAEFPAEELPAGPPVSGQPVIQPGAAPTPAPFDWAGAARLVWGIGAACTGLALAGSNLIFQQRLRRSRKPLAGVKSRLPVYVSRAVATPCLFGVFVPAIYLTPETAADPEMRAHVLAHETTHARHGDHIWALLRGVCLALHWYNPLVWWAAVVSRRDAELACDEASLLRLGESQRVAYGRTLLRMTSEKRPTLFLTATTMTGGKRTLRERIQCIAHQPRTAALALAAALLVLALAAGCTFTGRKASTPPKEPASTGSDEPESSPAPTPEPLNDGTAPLAKKNYVVPDLSQLTASDVPAQWEGFVLSSYLTPSDTVPAGQLISQHPAAGTPLVPGDPMMIALAFSSGPLSTDAPTTSGSRATVPDLSQLTADTVPDSLAGFSIQPQYEFSRTFPEGQLIYQTPEAGLNLAPDLPKVIIPTFSRGPLRLDQLEDKLVRWYPIEAEVYPVCVAFEPTRVSVEGGDVRFLTFQDQDTAWQALTDALTHAKPGQGAKAGEQLLGFQVYWYDEAQQQTLYWNLLDSGALIDSYLGRVEPQDAKPLFDLAMETIRRTSWQEPVRPAQLKGITSAALDWNDGTDPIVLTDPAALHKLEGWLTRSTESYPGQCWFTAYLTLTTRDGETHTIALATDGCAVWRSNGVYYDSPLADSRTLFQLFGVTPENS